MTNRTLEIFIMVAGEGNMSRAAKRLYITESSVSQAISGIEKEFGVVLFERFAHTLLLTETGKNLLRYANHLTSVQQEMTDYLNHESLCARIRIGATVTVGTCVASPILKELIRCIPALNHTVLISNTHTIEEQLISNALDIGLVEGYISNPVLVTRTAIHDRMVFVCSKAHLYYGRQSVSLREIAAEPLILREEGSGTRAQLEEQMKQRQLQCNVRWSSHSIEAIKNAIEHDMGVSVMSKRLLEKEHQSGQLWTCDIEDGDFRREFKLVYHKNKYLTETMKRFIEICCCYGQQENAQHMWSSAPVEESRGI